MVQGIWGRDGQPEVLGGRDKQRHANSFNSIRDSNGRVLGLSGNSPWLRDDSLRGLKGMPELRVIHFDHHGFLRSHPQSPLYSGIGFDALLNSQLVDIKLTLGNNDMGMEQVAKIKRLADVSRPLCMPLKAVAYCQR